MFRDQVVVITGGSSGLGLELARRLAADGARLALVARDVHRLEQAAQELRTRQAGARVTVESLDVREEAATTACMKRIADLHGRIDMLVNSAGILRVGYFEQIPIEDFRNVMEVNYFGVLNAIRAVLPHLKASRGRLVNIASVAGLTGAFGYTPYSSAKHALVGLSDSLRFELQPIGVRVHVVCPGEFDSPMVDEVDRYRPAECRAHALTIPKATVAQIASGTLAGIRANRYLIVPGATARAAVFATRVFPGMMRALGDRTVAQARRKG